MWNPSSSWQLRLRHAAGSLLLLALLTGPISLWLCAEPEQRETLSQIFRSVGSLIDSDERSFPVTLRGRQLDEVGIDLAGVPIYAQAADGEGILVGRMTAAQEALLAPAYAAACRGGCELLIAQPTRHLQEAIEVILAPDGVDGELMRARDELYPMLKRTLIARLDNHLNDTLAKLVAELPKEHADELRVVADDLRHALEGQTEDLIGRLANRSWDTLGFWGATSGAARVAGGKALSLFDQGKDKALDWIGLSEPAGPPNKRRVDFLSGEKKKELRRAIEDEVDSFWKREGDRILTSAANVIERHSGTTLDGLKEEWMDTLRLQVLERSWEESREEVMDMVSNYAEAFAARRLVTSKRPGQSQGPTLALAYAIRSSTRITRRPLLVLQPTADALPRGESAGALELGSYVDDLDPDAWDRLAATSPR